LKPVRVLHIIKSLGRGGAEMLLQETLAQHDKKNFEFHYIYFLPWKHQMVPGLEREGGIVTNIKATNNVAILMQLNKLVQYVKKNNIELVHCHLPWAGFAGRLLHRRTGIPVLYTEHNKQERYHKITRLLNKSTFNWQTKAVAVSADVAESIQKNIHPDIGVQTILNGVNTAHFIRDAEAGKKLRQQYGIAADAVVIGTIAVFRFQKRLKEWIDLFKMTWEDHPDIYGCLVGDGILNEEIRAHLKKQGMEHRILMPGLQTNVKDWYSAMDIFMMTSEFEGLPIALLEAMSMECAVVCTDAGGIKEVIRNQQDGLLSAVENWRDMKNDLALLIQDQNELREIGKRARQRVIDKFSIKQMVKETEDLYKATLHN
jgi:L-malate glycosyltransferase